MEDAHGAALTKAAPPRRRRWGRVLPRKSSIVAWLAAFPAAWGLFAACDALLPKGPPTPDFMLACGFGVLHLGSCCLTPIVGAVLLFYALLRWIDARVPLHTAPLFAVCFVCGSCRDVPAQLGGNGVLATMAAAALIIAEALVRRLRHELVTALCLFAVASLELWWFFALWIAAGI